jgi:hypothetical protein
VSANRCTDLHGGMDVLSAADPGSYLPGSNQTSIGLIVNMRSPGLQ